MGSKRFKPNTSNSFFGDFLYQQVIPGDHFLVHLKQVIPWQRFSDKLLQYYRGRGQEGRPPYDPAVLLKQTWPKGCLWIPTLPTVLMMTARRVPCKGRARAVA